MAVSNLINMTQTEAPTGTRRTVTHSGWTHVQVKQADGTWWNITVERAR